ncbi:methyltransferase domain-containing protein [Persicimonas caeni]|uniref:Methyltransferase domain-containing protein n=1 Tax=Persicimonas caeni TaxID=2292766 RepID=A0A4Y6PYY9_PERCE|nr:class I SAM-dependent methyltransferase [Persicimonas caeni]QDG53538.1 methyltransferase domain-containing protein [Persicimonas caeni]QED34759.1 methyltransferase domain-containing protein [Persicimonas caeni]
MDEVVDYYDQLAPTYDDTRFGHTWGQFLDRQEREVLAQWLPDEPGVDRLDLACGTGRTLDLATAGVDASAAMVGRARHRHPDTPIECARADALPYAPESFDAVFSLHFFMHLDPSYIRRVLAECHRVLRPGGLLAFDAPSDLRRRFNDYQPEGWHCATALHPLEVRRLASPLFELVDFRGVMFAPVHRLPETARRVWRPADSAVAQSRLGRWACSHFMFLLQRREP